MARICDELRAVDERVLRRLVENHASHTSSERAAELLEE